MIVVRTLQRISFLFDLDQQMKPKHYDEPSLVNNLTPKKFGTPFARVPWLGLSRFCSATFQQLLGF